MYNSMLRPSVILLSFFLLISSAASPAQAQYQNNDSSDNGSDSSNTARLDVRLAQLEEQMRRMEGAIEQLSYENKQLKAQAEKSNGDIQYRLQALESGRQGAVATASPPTASPPQQAPAGNDQASGDPMQAAQPPQEAENPDDRATAAAPAQQFATPRDHYNYAFRLMNQAKYADAGNSFIAFTRQYPHDPLIGNAYYWLGETYYVRRDYLEAADHFRQGYEAMPSGPKAGDNLLKLAMSLDALKKDTEACVVLKQVVSKFDGGSSIKSRAEQEINRIGCN